MAGVSGSRAEGRGSGAPRLPHGPTLLQASTWLLPTPALHPGPNVSRSCTDEGWAQLEPGPYNIACGLDDKESSLEEVGRSAPQPPPERLGLPGSFHSPPPRLGAGRHLCGSQDFSGLPSLNLLLLQACISGGSSPGSP